MRVSFRRRFAFARHCGELILLLGSGVFQSVEGDESRAPAVHPRHAEADFFVAPIGNDAWSGRLDQPNRAGTDGPFATLPRARDAVRHFTKQSRKSEFLVLVRGGLYRLRETLVFTTEDSAPEGGRITYAAWPGEKPVVSSGVPVERWRKPSQDPPGLPDCARGRIWEADAPAGIEKILTLYAEGHRLTRAATEGFGPPEGNLKSATADTVRFPAGTLHNWPDSRGAELRVIPTADYEMSLLPLAGIDEIAGIAKTTLSASRPIGRVKFFPVSAWVENVIEGLDQPGTWVFDTRQRKIYLWPVKPGRPLKITAPQLSELVRVEGQIDYAGPADRPVKGLVFAGFTFTQAERYPWHGATGWSLQHHWEMFDRPSAAFRFRGAEECAVESCRFADSGGAGIRLDLHCQKILIANNEISHIGGVGILLAGYGPGTKNVNCRNQVTNNWVHHTGEIYWASPAIMIWQSGENQVANNLIHNTPYSGITVSTRSWLNPRDKSGESARTVREEDVRSARDKFAWAELEPYLHARKNLIERNEIHHVMEVMGDGDGIYISGTGGGNHIRNNYIHDCESDHTADGIRCDDFQEEVIIEGNIICHCRLVGQGICSKGKNHILNNVIVDLLPSRLPIRPERVTRGCIGLVVNPVIGSRIQRNIVYCPRADFPLYTENRIYGTGGEPRLQDCEADNNIYYCVADPHLAQRHLNSKQPLGIEQHSLAVDPLFVNVDRRDFALRPQSPALKLGFQPIPMSEIGLHPASAR